LDTNLIVMALAVLAAALGLVVAVLLMKKRSAEDRARAGAVEAAVGRQLALLPRGNIAGESWSRFGAVIVLGSLDEAPPLADRIAAEHLEIWDDDEDLRVEVDPETLRPAPAA